jgi:hypothetical protein
MIVTRPYDNDIIVVKNFLNQDILDDIFTMLDSLDQSEWELNNIDAIADHLLNRVIPIDTISKIWFIKVMMDASKSANNIIKNVIDNSLTCEPFFMVNKIVGNGMKVHSDGDVPMPNPPKFGAVLYFNDNFSGGELVYDKLNIEYKPVAGDLVIHPGTKIYSHGVNNVTSGARYVSTLFAR